MRRSFVFSTLFALTFGAATHLVADPRNIFKPSPFPPDASYPSSGHWESYSYTSACPGTPTESRVCAEWFDAAFPERQTLCCISERDIGSTDFRDCQEVIYTGPRQPGGDGAFL